ncbi:MAG TPA: DinB family protein [Acidobacteriaceae bacterium]|jgi:hypothetical protein|nr:DinB family protein [Acidobacteriaceae bacterium]
MAVEHLSKGSLVLQEDTQFLLRKQLIASFHDGHVHSSFEQIFTDIPVELRGVKPAGRPFTLWRLLEHLRLGLLDFLDYCRIPGYVEPPVPEGYWPEGDAPPNGQAWGKSFLGFQSNMRELETLILDPGTDLFLPIPGGDGRTILRQAIACIDHNAYHLGQAMLLRRLLGIGTD